MDAAQALLFSKRLLRVRMRIIARRADWSQLSGLNRRPTVYKTDTNALIKLPLSPSGSRNTNNTKLLAVSETFTPRCSQVQGNELKCTIFSKSLANPKRRAADFCSLATSTHPGPTVEQGMSPRIYGIVNFQVSFSICG